MLKRSLFARTTWCKFCKRYAHDNVKFVKSKVGQHVIAKIRNIGILAHIDAGKTTTTERMLYYSGLIKNMGEVHHGNTVTDYMDQERERGITITSAAVSFGWKNYHFNLIDTPGHIDFTMEVEQTLSVLDGVVIVLDGCSGVEAQTITVCRQADRYNIPRIMYVNKMDRPAACFEMSLQSIESKLNVNILPIQLPMKEDGVLQGIVDVVTMEKLYFDKSDQGATMARTKLTENDAKLWELASEKRRLLTDKLSGLDDNLANIIIEQESLEKIPAQTLVDSLHRVTVAGKGVPVLLGSSYKNIGVQPLMDSVILYLPSPELNSYSRKYQCFGSDLSARVFKVVHDNQRGPITFMRIYTGSLKRNEKIHNVQREKNEQCGRLYVACADDYEEVPEISQGNIVAVAGLKSTVTGDLITNSASSASKAKKSMLKQKNADPERVDEFFATGTNVPDPVFFCSIESPSLSVQSALETALQQLQREDPSLRVTQNEETEQMVLAGMGELHLEVIRERIRTEYKIDAELGSLQIAYKEMIQKEIKDTYTMEHKIGKTNHKVTVTMSVIPNYKGKETLLLDKSPDSSVNESNIHPKVMQAVKRGTTAALLHGPKLSCPVVNVACRLHFLEVGRGTSITMVSAAVSQCIRKLLENADIVLLEPIMNLEIVSPSDYSSGILADLSRRRAEIRQIDVRGKNKVINSFTPLSELLGYSTALRIISSGNATFSLEFSHYQKMDSFTEEEAIRKVTGF